MTEHDMIHGTVEVERVLIRSTKYLIAGAK